MDNWPLASDYSVTLQNPSIAFKDDDLRQSVIKRDKNKQPFGISGQFAVVYQAKLPDGRRWAVRAFTSSKDERGERYQKVSEYLRHKQDVDALVDFKYHRRGIRAVDGKFYPMVTMEWVQGETLFDWVAAQCEQARTRDLRRLVDAWAALITDLRDAKIAHGDLQHGNVMVTADAELRLVDYDCMCVPELIGRRNLEIGVVPYQHPDRDEQTQMPVVRT